MQSRCMSRSRKEEEGEFRGKRGSQVKNEITDSKKRLPQYQNEEKAIEIEYKSSFMIVENEGPAQQIKDLCREMQETEKKDLGEEKIKII